MADMILHSNIVIKQEPTRTYLEVGNDFLLLPKKTTTQILSSVPTQGLIVYNITTNEFWIANGTTWKAITLLEDYEQIIPLNFVTTNTTSLVVVDVPMNNGDAVNLQIQLIGKLQESNQVFTIDYLSSAVKQAGVITIAPFNQRISKNFTNNPNFNLLNNSNLSVQFSVHSGIVQTINWRGKAIITKTNLP